MSEFGHNLDEEHEATCATHIGGPTPPLLAVNTEEFEAKTKTFLRGGVKHLHIVADFDYTLTHAFQKGQRADVSYSVLLNALDEDTQQKSRELTAHYLPIQNDPSIPAKEKEEHLAEWKLQGNQLIINSGCTRADLAEAVAKSSLKLRPGVQELILWCQTQNVPLTIVSAGLGDVIETVLSAEASLEGVDIRANFIEWDEGGRVKGFREGGVQANQKESALAGETLQPNVIVLGDSCADIEAVKLCHYSEALFIGVVVDPADVKEYEKFFTCLLLGDGDLRSVNSLLSTLSGFPE